MGIFFVLPIVVAGMPDATLDDRGRLTIPKELREQFGDSYHVVALHDGIKLVPKRDDPLASLREQFDDTDKSAEELHDEAREAALEQAGR